jgi:hypothetical protein
MDELVFAVLAENLGDPLDGRLITDEENLPEVGQVHFGREEVPLLRQGANRVHRYRDVAVSVRSVPPLEGWVATVR